jgi:hypothetical protein
VSYATPDDLRAYGAFLSDTIDIPGDDTEAQALIDRAGRDVEWFLGFPPPPDPAVPTAPLPDRITGLPRYETRMLNRAVCAQACYRVSRDEGTLLEGQPDIISAGGITFAASAPPIMSPQTFIELSGAPLLHWWRHGLGVPDDPPTDAPAAA